MPDEAEALVYAAPGLARIERVALPAMARGMVEVRTRFSGLSRGTERLVFEGRVPEGEYARMRAPFQTGEFPFPVRYGYAAVGTVEAGPAELLGREVFALHPHQTRFRLAADAVLPLPAWVPPARAVLAANMETALNALWDASPAPGARILVVGAGLLGWLVTALLAARPDLSVDVTDIRPEAGAPAAGFGVRFLERDAAAGAPPPARGRGGRRLRDGQGGGLRGSESAYPHRALPLAEFAPTAYGAYDLAFHASASAAGLQTALDALAFEGRVIELSWFGDRPVPLLLGGAFHANRLSIRASQVGHVAGPRRAALGRRDRLARAIAALADARLDRLVTDEVPFALLPDALPGLLAPGASGIATRVRY